MKRHHKSSKKHHSSHMSDKKFGPVMPDVSDGPGGSHKHTHHRHDQDDGARNFREAGVAKLAELAEETATAFGVDAATQDRLHWIRGNGEMFTAGDDNEGTSAIQVVFLNGRCHGDEGAWAVRIAGKGYGGTALVNFGFSGQDGADSYSAAQALALRLEALRADGILDDVLMDGMSLDEPEPDPEPVNHAPVAVDDTVTVGEDASAVLDLLGNDSDPDFGDAPVVAEIDASGALGTVVLGPDGTVSYDPAGQFEALAAGETATDRFAYRVTDSNGALSDWAWVTVTIEGAHDLPVLASGALAVDEDATAQLDLSTLVAGAESALSWQITGSGGGSAAITDGVLDFAASGFDALAAGETETVELALSAQDAAGGTVATTVTVTVTGVNDAPVALGETVTVGEDASAVLDLLGNDSDPDFGDAPVVAEIDASGALGTVVLGPDGTVSYDPAGQFEALAAGETATDRFAYRVTDSNGALSDWAWVTVTIEGAHDLPVLASGALAVDEDATAQLDLSTLVAGAESALSWQITGSGGGSAAITDGVLDFAASGFDALAAGETETVELALSAQDAAGGTVATTVTVTVTGVNDAPVALGETVTVGEDASAVLDLLGNDSDPDFGDAPVVAEIDASGALGTVVLGPDGTVSYDPAGQFEALAAGETATDRFAYRVTDSNGALSDWAWVTVTIEGATDVPILENGGFESGLNGWETVGLASVVTGQRPLYESGTISPTEGSRMLRLYSTGASDQTVANLMDVSLVELEAADGESDLILGAAAVSTIQNVSVGDVISFDWLFDSGDGAVAQDSAMLLTVNGDLLELADSSDIDDYGSTGWQTTTFTASEAGDLAIGFAVFDVTDAARSSVLYVDDIHFL